MNAQDKGDAMPPVQGNKRCDHDTDGRWPLHQDEGVLQPAHLQDQGSGDHRTKTKAVTIRWADWNPFQRVTGRALQQLNKRQRKQKALDDAPEALL
jgi:hypothetical protein